MIISWSQNFHVKSFYKNNDFLYSQYMFRSSLQQLVQRGHYFIAKPRISERRRDKVSFIAQLKLIWAVVVAQLVERLLLTPGIRGSNQSSAKFKCSNSCFEKFYSAHLRFSQSFKKLYDQHLKIYLEQYLARKLPLDITLLSSITIVFTILATEPA